ncbi:MAG: TonB-dependent receptor [Porticoccaceae bacterium]
MAFPKLDKLALAVALHTAAGLPAAALAVQIDEVVVSAKPIRDSELAAIEAKRDADNYVDIISADTIGRFPDQNLADSLGRLPGLAIERDQGQARYINLRGAPFRYTSIAFDGIDVPGAESGRIPRFDSFPSVITNRLEANKAILPNMPGESIAGHINVHTFNPFDQEGWSLATDMGFGEQDLGGGDVDKYSLRTSWSNDTIGVVLFGSQNSREQITDTREYDLERASDSELIVNELDFRSYKVEREDHAWGGRLEYRGEGTLRSMFLSTLYSEFVDNEERNQYVFGFSDPTPGLTGEAAPVSVSRMLEAGEYKNSTLTNTLGADLQLGSWLVAARISRTETEFDMDLPIPRSMGGTANANYDLTDIEDPKVWLDTDLAAMVYPTTIGLHYVQALDVETDKFKLDAERDMVWFGRDAKLELGVQYDTRDADGYISTAATGAFPASVDIDSFNTGKPWDANTANTIGGTYYDNTGLRRAWAASGTLTMPVISPENEILIAEDILAVYAMATTEFDWGNVVIGTRIEQTDYTSKGTVLEGPLSVSDTFTNVLPSAHVNINLTDDVKLRVSASTGISRPTYNEWRAAASLDIADRRVTGGNPHLEAEEAVGLDVALEWYFAPASIASVGAFYRAIDNVIYADSSTIDGGLYLPAAAGETWTYIGSVNGDDGRMQGLEFNFVGHAAELLPAPFDGFGFSANVTVLDTEFKGIDGVKYDLPGTSDLIYNASLFYEKYDVSVRLNYQYRDEWISPIEDPSEYWGEQKRLDLTAIYTLPFDLNGATLSVYANVNNLTDETDVRYAGNGTINQSESYGRYYLLGFRVNY